MNGRDLLAWLRRNRILAVVAGGGLLLALFLLANGGREQDNTSRVVEVTRLVSVTAPAAPAREVTRVVVVTATPSALPPRNGDPATLQQAVASGPVTLDPAQAGDAAAESLLRNVLETLVYPDPLAPGNFLPLLAARWQVEDGGARVTFTLRRGVSFSNGTPLTVSDLAYSLHRLLLQSGPGRPQGLLLEPLFGFQSGDLTEGLTAGPFRGNRAALLENTTEQQRVALCERLHEAIVADMAAGTVTMTLAEPWAPLLALLSQPWAGIVSGEWAAERSDWDGSCATWSDWYGRPVGEGPLATALLGTGPYVLDRWTPGSEYVLQANTRYWRNALNPMWEGGPAGQPALSTVRIAEVDDDVLRWELLRDGKVAAAPLSPPAQLLAEQLVGEVCTSVGCAPGPVPAGPLRRVSGPPESDFLALAFNFAIVTDDNPFIGSGELDGEGIPPTFFGDRHVRRAFAFCFDDGAYLGDFAGAGPRAGTLLPAGWAAAITDPHPYDIGRCDEELQLAWENQLPDAGFRMQLPYLAGDPQQQAAATLLQASLQEIDPNYQIETLGLPAGAYVQALLARQLPVAFVRWASPLPDPHYHAAPLFDAELQEFQSLPPDLQEQLEQPFLAGLEEVTPEARREPYQRLEEVWQEELPYLLLPRPAAISYQQRWLQGWLGHPEAAAPYYYAVTQQGADE